ncbi:type IV toxin-antitoxin system AbiEi family antitoxin [Rhizobium sp. K1/93]|uniref:type IV toxin-antitoxin system AbiEi family antitoxin domain-containing protein n=1 Tax=Rhizobium sp. K1/93 TaxID=2819997 RepID=UPI001C5B9926|nr:type IV toxin-antitoxin system AbiEi family antitoxin [Rhizobium sp. K1/93]
MNKTLMTPYYVAMLSAAELYGVSPYAIMVTQVMVPERRRAVAVGRHRVEFQTRSRLDEMPTGWHETSDGRFKVSTPELTVLDIIQHESMLGGIPRVREVLHGMWMHCSKDAVAKTLDAVNNVSLAQRLGALMEMDGQDELSLPVERWLKKRPLQIVPLTGGRQTVDNKSVSQFVDHRFKVRIAANIGNANA